MKNYAIILSSGTGSRFGEEIPKQFIKVHGKTILEHTIEIFEKAIDINEIVVVITPQYQDLAEEIINKNQYKKVKKLLPGGQTRKESSSIGVSAIEDREANVLIHDCARPFLSQEIVKSCISALNNFEAVLVAIPSVDTIVKIENNVVSSVLKRNELMCAQTPQCFRLSLIKKAHELSKNDNEFTDDCGLVVKYNLADVHIVNGSIENIKITYKADILAAENYFKNS